MGRWSRSAIRKAARRRSKLLRHGETPPRNPMGRTLVLAGLYSAALAAVFVVAAALADGCYAHTPTPSCAADPSQPWCPSPIHDRRADAGR